MAAKYNFDVSAAPYSRTFGIRGGLDQLSDGTPIMLRRNGTSGSLVLSYGNAARTVWTNIATVATASAAFGTLCVDNADNIYVFFHNASNPMSAKAYVKGAGLTWTPAATVSITLSGTSTYHLHKPVWCNTGGGINGKGHIVTSWPEANNQTRLRSVDAGVLLAGSGAALVSSGPNTNAAAAEDNGQISSDGFGATTGLFAHAGAGGANYGLGVDAWSVASNGVLTVSALTSVINPGSAHAVRVFAGRVAANTWIVLFNDISSGVPSSKWFAAKYSSTAQLTGPTTYGTVPTNWGAWNTLGANHATFAVDPTGNKVWIYTIQASGSQILQRLGVSVAGGLTWDTSVTVEDATFFISSGAPGFMRAIPASRSSIVDYQSHDWSPSGALYQGLGGITQFNQPPNQPTWVLPSANTTANLSGTYALQWTFSDPDAGNTQSGVYIQATTTDGAGPSYWWTGSTWSPTETKIVQSGQTYTMPVDAFGNNHYYDLQVATEDNNNAKSIYSATVRLQGLPTTPTSFTPDDASTVTSETPILTAVRATSAIPTKGHWQLASDASFVNDVRIITGTISAASGTATESIPSGSRLFQGNWYIRAAVVDLNGVASGWTSPHFFTVMSNVSTYDVQAYLRITPKLTHGVDSIIIPPGMHLQHSVDALLQKKQSKTVSVDGVLQKSLTRTHTVNASIKLIAPKTHSVDAVLRKKITQLHGVDVWIVSAVARDYAVDTLLLKKSIRSHSVDASVRKIISLTHGVTSSTAIRSQNIGRIDAVVSEVPVTPWWNDRYPYRRNVFVMSDFGVVQAGHPVSVSYSNSDLYNLGKTLFAYSDMRALAYVDGEWVLLGQSITVEGDVVDVEFPLLRELLLLDSSYYVYYGNKDIDPPLSPAYTPDPWPVRAPWFDHRVAYTRPGEHWVDGISETTDAKATLAFYGNAIQLVSRTNRDQGILEIQVDDNAWESIDLFSPYPVEEAIVYTRSGLSSGIDEHQIRVRVAGKKNPMSTDVKVNIVRFEYRIPLKGIDLGEEINSNLWG